MRMQLASVARTLPARAGLLPRVIRISLAALVVAASAQVVVPAAFTPVPITLQPLAVLAVAGVLGAAEGGAALVLYLAAGLLGFPVFAGGGFGILRLIGPTGGYLLAFPFAAAVTGLIAHVRGEVGPLWRVLAACVAGMAIIHAGGVAQLAVLGGDPALAFRMGFVPFFTGDLLKIGLAAAIILLLAPRVRPAT
ncbi:MAG: biotin transporter BioY [Gemmatimonadales bacterium]|nr:biotin transporter BioY [Gemmatimonadales bacterium]